MTGAVVFDFEIFIKSGRNFHHSKAQSYFLLVFLQSKILFGDDYCCKYLNKTGSLMSWCAIALFDIIMNKYVYLWARVLWYFTCCGGWSSVPAASLVGGWFQGSLCFSCSKSSFSLTPDDCKDESISSKPVIWAAEEN